MYVYKSLQPSGVASKKQLLTLEFLRGGRGREGSRLIEEEPHIKQNY